MTKNINSAVRLTSYFVTLPPALHIVVAMLLLGLLFGFLINIGQHSGPELIYNSVIDGMMLLSLPALLSSMVVKLMVRKMPSRRIAATAFGGEIVYAVAYGASLLLSGVDAFLAQLVLLIGSAVVFVFWYAIARFIFILKYRSILFAIIQLLFYIVFLASNQALYLPSESFIGMAARFYVSSFVLLMALVLFFFIINAPMKRSFGVSSTDAVAYFFSQWLYNNKDLEKAFERVGEPAKTIACIMGFKRKNDRVIFFTPYVHYGPFGNLGGSEFSYLLAEELDKKYNSKTFVFHGTVTHDLNPVSSSEISGIMAAADSALQDAKYSDARVSLSIGKSDECRAEALVINDSALIGLTRAPEVTEDINFGLGLSLMLEAEKKVKTAMIIDQHNAETGDITSFEPGSTIGFRYLDSVRDSLSKAGKENALKLGISFRSVDSEVVGKAGVKLAVLSSSPEYVIVLIDSNGVTPEFRYRIEREITKLAKSMGHPVMVGVFTTDTHQTNITRGVVNPAKDEDELLSAIKQGFKEALGDMQPASFFADKRWFEIKVLGAKQSIEIVSTVNSIVAITKITLPLILLGALLLVVAVLSKL